jgi:hypothetical protein
MITQTLRDRDAEPRPAFRILESSISCPSLSGTRAHGPGFRLARLARPLRPRQTNVRVLRRDGVGGLISEYSSSSSSSSHLIADLGRVCDYLIVLMVRHHGPILDPAWSVSDVSREDLVLANIGRKMHGSPAARTLRSAHLMPVTGLPRLASVAQVASAAGQKPSGAVLNQTCPQLVRVVHGGQGDMRAALDACARKLSATFDQTVLYEPASAPGPSSGWNSPRSPPSLLPWRH